MAHGGTYSFFLDYIWKGAVFWLFGHLYVEIAKIDKNNLCMLFEGQMLYHIDHKDFAIEFIWKV